MFDLNYKETLQKSEASFAFTHAAGFTLALATGLY